MEQAEVPAGDGRDGRTRLGVRKIGAVKGTAQLPPVTGKHEGQLVALQGAVMVGEADATIKVGIEAALSRQFDGLAGRGNLDDFRAIEWVFYA